MKAIKNFDPSAYDPMWDRTPLVTFDVIVLRDYGFPISPLVDRIGVSLYGPTRKHDDEWLNDDRIVAEIQQYLLGH